MALTDNIVSYWKLDESSGDASDSTGNGYTLTNVNTATYVSALINNGGDLGASNTNKRFFLTSSMGYLKTSSWTQAGWIKLKNENTSLWNIFDSRNSTDGYLQYVRYDFTGSNHVLIAGSASNGVGATDVTYTVALGTTNWHHVASVCDGTNVSLYLDGSIVAGPTARTAFANGSGISNQTTLGASGNGYIYASIILDEVGYWSRDLSGAEITELYNGGAGLSYPFTATFTPTPLMHMMQMAGGIV